MTIGIVTWHKGNIGGTLQAYALSQTVKKMGYEVELINPYISKYARIKAFLRNQMFHIIYRKSGLTRDYTFKFIEDKLIETPNLTYNKLKSYSNRYSAVICGSDQIWSCVNGVNPLYFLQFADIKKRIAYAPSIGLESIKDEYQALFSKYVSEMKYLSVRESKGAEIIKELTGLDAKVVLDPTFLLTQKEWLKLTEGYFCNSFGLEPGNYILCYYLGDDSKYRKYTEMLEKKTGKKAIYVSFKRKNFGRKQIVCSIEEFLALIRDADYILTDSFHGTVVPINMGKKVAVFERFTQEDPLNQNSRIYNILSRLGVTDWLITPTSEVECLINRDDDFERIQRVIEIEREKSMSYLFNCLDIVCNK